MAKATRTHRLYNRRWLPPLLLTGSALLALYCTAASAQQSAGPSQLEITDCRPGFGGIYKTGYWTPVDIELAGGSPRTAVVVEVLTPDDDGVPTSVRTGPISFGDDGRATAQLFVKSGRGEATFTVNLLEDGRVVRSRDFVAGRAGHDSSISPGLPTSTELVLHLGSAELDLDQLTQQQRTAGDQVRQVAQVTAASGLARQWYGYDAVDMMVISTSEPGFFADLPADDPRLVAIGQWVELGGRLLVLCGENAEQLLAAGAPLADLVPGEFQEMVSIDRVRAIEQYSETDTAVPARGRIELPVPRLVDVAGRVEAFEGSGPDDLPLVIRSTLGFGELVFAGVDLDRPPFADWQGRTEVVRRLLQVDRDRTVGRFAESRTITTRGFDDLAGALRNRLGQSFAGVAVVPFGLVAILVIGYLVLIGPVDYLLVKRVLGHMEWTWVTFLLIILLVSWGAFAFAQRRKGSDERINLVEVVDFDLANGIARGDLLACLYSPHATTYEVSLAARWPDGSEVNPASAIVSWFGMPGKGLGGMHSASRLPTAIETSYRYGPGLRQLENLPVETWSTKSLAARWHSPAPQVLTADLAVTRDDLVEGTIGNETGVALADARLLYGTWGWRLGDLPADGSVTIDSRRDPLKVRTLLTSDLRGPGGVFVPEEATVDELLDVMMFYEAVGGKQFSQLASRYKANTDLSRQLDLGRAVLLGRCDEARSELLDEGQAIRSATDRSWTVYRFVIPVQENEF